MNAPIITFFNAKGRIGTTSLVYHLAWMYANLETRVVVVDLDPQADLTTTFLDDYRLQELWTEGASRQTIYGCLEPLIKGIGEVGEPHLEEFDDAIGLLVGDLELSSFEEQLSEVWRKCSLGDEQAFRLISAFWRMMQQAAITHEAELILVDLGPNLGAINRAALIASDYVVIPLTPEQLSLEGLRHLGPSLRRWRQEWHERIKKNPVPDLPLPTGRIEPAGHVVLLRPLRLDLPIKPYQYWYARIPDTYRTALLDQAPESGMTVPDDPYLLGLLKHYSGLKLLAQEARKPMFNLKPADGAMGSRLQAARRIYYEFKQLALAIAERTGVSLQ